MKKTIYSTLLLSSLLLAGCQDNSAAPNESEPETETDSTEQVDELATDETEDTSETTHEEETDEDDVEEEVTYQYQMNPTLHTVEPIESAEETDEKLVLLTFNDAPYGNSLKIANTLNEHDASAIFFVNSMYMDEEGTEVVQELYDMGFEIGNHTHTHALLRDYTEEKQREEIVTTNDRIEEATGERPRFFRAPHGVMTEYSEQVVADEGMIWMNWSFGYDFEPEYRDPAALAEITLNTELLGDGANILMHDREWTAEAVPAIVDGLLEQGFTIADPKLISHEE